MSEALLSMLPIDMVLAAAPLTAPSIELVETASKKLGEPYQNLSPVSVFHVVKLALP